MRGDEDRGVAAVLRADVRDARALAKTGMRAEVRGIRNDDQQLGSIIITVLLFGVGAPLYLFGPAGSLGARLAGGNPPIGTLGAIFANIATAGAYVGVMPAISQTDIGAIGPLVRTSIPTRAIAMGRIANDTVQSSILVVPGAVILLGAVAYGAGGPLAPLFLLAGGLPIYVLGLLVGRLGGTAGRDVYERLGVSQWAKVAILVAAFGVFVALLEPAMELLFGESDGLATGAPSLLPGTPIQAYASVVFAPLGAAMRPLGIAVATLTVVALAASFTTTLYLEGIRLSREERDENDDSATSRAVPALFDRVHGGRIAWRYLIRTARDPGLVSHLLPLSFGLFVMGGAVAADPTNLVTQGPAAATILGGIVAGAAYCLNPLGDDRDGLPLVLTSAPSAKRVLRGRILAGTTLGLGIAVGVGGPLALLSGDPVRLLAPLVFAPVYAFAAAGAALGIGALLPTFERRTYMYVERAHPSNVVFFGYVLGTAVVGFAGLALIRGTVTGGLELPWILGGWAMFSIVVVGTSLGGYRFSVRKFDRFTLDDV